MQKHSFNRDWQFALVDPSVHGWMEPAEERRTAVDLPHDWSIGLDRSPNSPCGASGGYFPTGRGWYRKTFDAPAAWRGQKAILEFEGVYMNAEVRLNEHFLARHPYGYTTFFVDLTPCLRIGEKNTLTVTVDNAHQLNSRWYSGSGIYRPVWLHLANPVHIPHWGICVTTPEAGAKAATVRVRTEVRNDTGQRREITLRTRILAPSGRRAAAAETRATVKAGGSRTIEVKLPVKNPRLWSPETPALYTLASEVRVAGRAADSAETPFGIRTIAFSPDKGFLLNGAPVKLKGGCVHHDHGIIGSAAHARAEERKVEIHKSSGYNAIRTAHNPPSPAFLDACDRLGMLVLDEAFDCWRDGKNPGDYHIAFDDWWPRDLEAMVLRDRNHPCVFCWSVGNETLERDGRSGGAAIAQMLADRTRRLDPTRPVTAAICGIWNEKDRYTWESTDAVFAPLDVGGYNYQWREYAKDHARHPRRIMMGTESFPLEALDNWQAVLANDCVIGDFVWTSLDYLGESGIGRVQTPDQKPLPGEYPWHQANCGDLDLCGFKRPQSYYRDMVWGVGDPVRVFVQPPAPGGAQRTVSQWGWADVAASWTWAGHEGQPMQVEVYSRCERVELFLNGRSLGAKPTTAAQRLQASFEAPYEPGELRAVGFDGRRRVFETVLATAGAPAAIRLTPDRAALRAGEGDLCYVTVEVTDALGRFHPAAGHEIRFSADGAGRLLAVGSADPVSAEPYVGNRRRVFRGRCLAVLLPGREPGEIRLTAEADGLRTAEILVRVAPFTDAACTRTAIPSTPRP